MNSSTARITKKPGNDLTQFLMIWSMCYLYIQIKLVDLFQQNNSCTCSTTPHLHKFSAEKRRFIFSPLSPLAGKKLRFFCFFLFCHLFMLICASFLLLQNFSNLVLLLLQQELSPCLDLQILYAERIHNQQMIFLAVWKRIIIWLQRSSHVHLSLWRILNSAKTDNSDCDIILLKT